jgi:hypothetical protein
MIEITIERITRLLQDNNLEYSLDPTFRERMVEIEVGDVMKMTIEYREVSGLDEEGNNIYSPCPNKAWILYHNSGGELKEVRCKYMDIVETIVDETVSLLSIRKMSAELNPSPPPPSV